MASVTSLSPIAGNISKTSRPRRVLAIQSHVVHGYVGNKSAVFPLQLNGLDVDPLNTAHFSTHTGYGRVEGTRTSPEELRALVSGLDANGLLEGYSWLLTGYVGRLDLLKAVAETVATLKLRNPSMRYCKCSFLID